MQTRNYAQETPDMVLYRQNKKTSLGYVKNIHNWTADYNFGAASEMSFEVPKKVYDTRTNSWMDNPNYDNLKPDMLLYLNDSTEYFKFTGESYYADYLYNLKGGGTRKDYELSFDVNTAINNFNIKNETMLFDIGTTYGYEWVWGGTINDGVFEDYSESLDLYKQGWYTYQYLACKSFIPVHKGDVIATKCFNGDTLRYSFKIHYYKEANADSWLKSDDNYYHESSKQPFRRYVDFTVKDSDGNIENNTDTIDEGYIRISLVCSQATYSDNTYRTYIPNASWVQIFSRERLCTHFETNKNKNYGIRNVWWVITNTEEINDNGSNAVLKVTAQSYEMTLSKRVFSLSNSTLPLFVPDHINDLVTSDNWYYDCYGNTRHKQKFVRGLLNQILDYLPQWKIGYVSQAVCVRYRTLDDVDNANVYTFLNNDIASSYQCYFIFDSENMTINIIDGNIETEERRYYNTDEKYLGTHSRVILTWQNAIKNTNVHTTDDRCISALRVHTSNDQYGLGLINPTGNNILYNFSNIENQLDYVADDTKNRTLKEALTVWQTNIEKQSVKYANNGALLIECNKKKIEQASKVSKALTTYLTVADTINTHLIDKYGFSDKPLPNSSSGELRYAYQVLVDDHVRIPSEMRNPPYDYINYDCYYSKSLYTKLYSAAETYWNTKNDYDNVVTKYNICYNKMQTVAKKFTLNYKTALQANKDGIATILSPAEILELQNYITEGDWTNDNIVFSDTYSANDIIATLQEAMAQAKSVHDNYLSKQCYEFEIESANILTIPEMKDNIRNLTLGTALSLEVKDGDWQYPILLSIHVHHGDVLDFSLTFNTNYSAKPLKKRFIDCFNTISQTSVRNTTFNFTE